MEEGRITPQDWLKRLISIRSGIDGNYRLLTTASLTILILLMTITFLYYLEFKDLLAIPPIEVSMITLLISIVMVTLIYLSILSRYRLWTIDKLIDKIMIDNKTNIDFIKGNFQLILKMLHSRSIKFHRNIYSEVGK